MEESQAPNIKQVIVMRHDLKMRSGKQIAQGAHASMSFLTRKLQSKASICMDDFSPNQQTWIMGSFGMAFASRTVPIALPIVSRHRGERTTFRSSNGSSLGTASQSRNNTTFRDSSGRSIGSASNSGARTTFRDGSGRSSGSASSNRR